MHCKFKFKFVLRSTEEGLLCAIWSRSRRAIDSYQRARGPRWMLPCQGRERLEFEDLLGTRIYVFGRRLDLGVPGAVMIITARCPKVMLGMKELCRQTWTELDWREGSVVKQDRLRGQTLRTEPNRPLSRGRGLRPRRVQVKQR